MNTSTDAGQRALEIAREAAAKVFDARARRERNTDACDMERHHAKVIRDGKGDDYDAVQAAKEAILAAFASPVTPAAATIPEGLREGGTDRQAVMRAFHVADDAPELNLSNYDHDDVAALNAAIIEVWQILGEAQAANAAVKYPIPPATIPGGEREVVARRLRELVSCIAHDADRSATEAFELIAALTSTGEASDEVLADAGGAFQPRVQPWLLACFGAEIAADKIERNHRFLEEALELVQALGCTASEAHQLVDYTFSRDIGEPSQEVGGVMVTLAALCLARDLDMHSAGETELARIWTKVDAIRAKQAAKPKHSPLPAPSANPVPVDAGGVEDLAKAIDERLWKVSGSKKPADLIAALNDIETIIKPALAHTAPVAGE